MLGDGSMVPIETELDLCNCYMMNKISLDSDGCQTPDDFYDILLSALEAPEWHGRNLDALWDSITSDINGIIPPYSIDVVNTAQLPESVSLLLSRIKSLFEEAKMDRGLLVEFHFS